LVTLDGVTVDEVYLLYRERLRGGRRKGPPVPVWVFGLDIDKVEYPTRKAAVVALIEQWKRGKL
jgi:hypothetical protein